MLRSAKREWSGPLYEVRAHAPDMGWRMRCEVHLAVAFEGDVCVDDPDGIVVEAAFFPATECAVLLASCACEAQSDLIKALETRTDTITGDRWNGFDYANAADVQDDVQQILQTGQVTVASIGAQTVDITPEMATLNSLPEGSQIVTADKGSPAASAGLQPGDIITQIDDVRLDAAHPLALLLRSRFHADQRVTVTYSRGATSTQAQLKLIGRHPTC